MVFEPSEEADYRRILYDNNLDLLFHRICYWSNGRRSVLDIVNRLEIELRELEQDTSISRTSTDMSIEADSSEKVNLEAVLYVVNKLVASDYLKIVADQS